ncbi:MAG: TIGR03985 family CRISPR-associated protein [Rhizonema sp. NSF051]|nr:TIGR03985 family CRISPR-associated protein [Rhizonema sp. NSF051]
MAEQLFQDIPQVELLQWLARGSLKQNLCRAIRLWVWLNTLYGESKYRLPLPEPFTFADWRDNFFTPTHTKGEEIPKLHDANCPCAKTTAEWLFDAKTGILETEWKRSLISHTAIDTSLLDELLQRRLFGLTRRSLQGDLEILAELGWLVYQKNKYYPVHQFPSHPTNIQPEPTAAKLGAYEWNFLHPDLAAMSDDKPLRVYAQNHSQQIDGVQRFFLKLDYVIPSATIDQVDNWQYELKELWAKKIVPPIKLTYDSARVGNTVDCIVYPVCIYYVPQAVYLCAFGESPDRKTDWYNFRLDRIQRMTPLEWKHPLIPQLLRQGYQTCTLPSPDDIAVQLSQAWGFDFYLPKRLILLRFQRDYHDLYIKDTFRHETFESITYQQTQHLITQEVPQLIQQQSLLEILAHRSQQDAYYRLDYRHRDNNVIMRLRAWRPQCEVLLPWDLRQNMKSELQQEAQLYDLGF